MDNESTEPPTAWNATERSRAQTRALLMALSRDRAKAFRDSFAGDLLVGIVTAGIGPLFQICRRHVRMRRLEWSQRLEYANWVDVFATENLSSAGLVYAPRVALEKPPSPFGQIMFVAALFVGSILFSRLRGANATHPMTYIWEGQLRDWISAIGLLLTCCWIGMIELIWSDWRRGSQWLARFNWALNQNGSRVITGTSFPIAPWLLAACFGAILVAQSKTAVPLFLVPMLFGLLFQIWIFAEARRINLQLIERLLEWMDDTGLPVEYEVTALNPDEIAAMMR